MIHRLIPWLSPVGTLLALRLEVPKARGFDQSSLGVSKPAEVFARARLLERGWSGHMRVR